MIAAVDNFGEVYLSMTQVTTDSNMMCMYLHHLVALLEEEDPNFRESTVFVIDGAKYHDSSQTRALMELLDLPIVLSAPFSYNLSVCELFFAALKSNNINPNGLPTGRSKYRPFLLIS